MALAISLISVSDLLWYALAWLYGSLNMSILWRNTCGSLYISVKSLFSSQLQFLFQALIQMINLIVRFLLTRCCQYNSFLKQFVIFVLGFILWIHFVTLYSIVLANSTFLLSLQLLEVSKTSSWTWMRASIFLWQKLNLQS